MAEGLKEDRYPMPARKRHSGIIREIFRTQYKDGQDEVDFVREDIVTFAQKPNIELPRNPDDSIYSFRYRTNLPIEIMSVAPDGKTWIIRSVGRSKYRFVLVSEAPPTANPNLAVTKIADATLGIITKYAFNDEQAVLARARYDRSSLVIPALEQEFQRACRMDIPRRSA